VLLLSLITLFAGPLLFQWISGSGGVARTLDRVVVAVLVVLVVVLLIPDIIQPLGLWAPALVMLGYGFPWLLEKLVRRAAESLHLLSLYVALAGLLLHALLDGAGLAGSGLEHHGGGENLALAIILHRFGMGLMLWLIMQPAFGNRVAWGTLAAIAAATIVGFEFSARLLPYAGDTGIMGVQAVIIGTIIHSLLHRGHVHGASHDSH
jgi:hypothetical protein